MTHIRVRGWEEGDEDVQEDNGRYNVPASYTFIFNPRADTIKKSWLTDNIILNQQHCVENTSGCYYPKGPMNLPRGKFIEIRRPRDNVRVGPKKFMSVRTPVDSVQEHWQSTEINQWPTQRRIPLTTLPSSVFPSAASSAYRPWPNPSPSTDKSYHGKFKCQPNSRR